MTAKVAIQLAIQVLSSEEGRRKLAIALCVPIAALMLIASLLFYVLTMPLQLLSGFFAGSDYNAVVNTRIENGFDQYLDPNDEDYISGTGLDFSGVSFTDGAVEVCYYSQLDDRWKDVPYGLEGTIGSSGCGPTSLAIVVSSLTGTAVDPVQTSAWSYKNGYRCEGNGSYHALMPNGAKHYGLTVEGISRSEPQKLVDALASGKLVIAIMVKGHFTKCGHFIVLRGVTADGKILVADPASKKRSEQEWDLEIIIAEAHKNPGAGGPFWAIGTD